MFSINNYKNFTLESGLTIPEIQVAYHTFGRLNHDKSNVIWVNHALTANSDVCDWWEGLFGKSKLFDPENYFIVCPNSLGSCYGTTGPSNAVSGDSPLLDYFPLITTRDQAKVNALLRQTLGIEKVSLLIGASIGGQQALEWTIQEQDNIEQLILIATNAEHSAFGRAFNESQRLAIYNDPTYGKNNINGGKNGLLVARSIAMLSYRSYEGYEYSQREWSNNKMESFDAGSYQRYQGSKLSKRFNAYSYVTLSKTMDSHCISRGRGTIESVLNEIRTKTLVIGIQTDILFPPKEQKRMVESMPNAIYQEIESNYGHDGFLIEIEQLERIVQGFHQNKKQILKPTVFKRQLAVNN